jgi:hypothetical protein
MWRRSQRLPRVASSAPDDPDHLLRMSPLERARSSVADVKALAALTDRKGP